VPSQPIVTFAARTFSTEADPVSRHDWLHGLLACPTCGLPLDKDRDLTQYLWRLEAQPYGRARPDGPPSRSRPTG
jgi:hypothetical protein